jgi:hypothetical protein
VNRPRAEPLPAARGLLLEEVRTTKGAAMIFYVIGVIVVVMLVLAWLF